MTEGVRSYSALTDDALIGLLFTESDLLPREAVDEMISRGSRMADPLTWIVMDPASWRADGPSRWAPIHATLVLGAIGGDAAVLGLLTAADQADACHCRVVLDALPSIFGRFGAEVRPYLSERVRDPKRGASSRAKMAECLAATAARDVAGAEAVFAELGAVFAEQQDDSLDLVVGRVLLDFRRAECRAALLAYASRRGAQPRGETTGPAFTPEEVERALVPDASPNLEGYTADWLAFYAPEKIAARQAGRANQLSDATAVDVEMKSNEWQPDAGAQVVRSRPKVGRNALCPCGSGKKYKKCCLEVDAALGSLNSLA
jgi:hypothetical protein